MKSVGAKLGPVSEIIKLAVSKIKTIAPSNRVYDINYKVVTDPTYMSSLSFRVRLPNGRSSKFIIGEKFTNRAVNAIPHYTVTVPDDFSGGTSERKVALRDVPALLAAKKAVSNGAEINLTYGDQQKANVITTDRQFVTHQISMALQSIRSI